MASPGSLSRVLGVLGGAAPDRKRLVNWASTAQLILAADSGADVLLEAGVVPHIVVGDLDSLQSEPKLLPDVRQNLALDSTDCDKLLSVALMEGAVAITVMAAEGDLPDHALASLHSFAKSPLKIRIVYRRGFGYILKPEETRRTLAGGRVSLLPITSSLVSLTGVRWPLDHVLIEPTGASSISNEAKADEVVASVHQGVALLFVESETEPRWDEE